MLSSDGSRGSGGRTRRKTRRAYLFSEDADEVVAEAADDAPARTDDEAEAELMALVDAILQQACTRTPQQARARTTVARGHCNCGHAEGLPHGSLSQVLVAAEAPELETSRKYKRRY